jgi:hypothetical protein
MPLSANEQVQHCRPVERITCELLARAALTSDGADRSRDRGETGSVAKMESSRGTPAPITPPDSPGEPPPEEELPVGPEPGIVPDYPPPEEEPQPAVIPEPSHEPLPAEDPLPEPNPEPVQLVFGVIGSARDQVALQESGKSSRSTEARLCRNRIFSGRRVCCWLAGRCFCPIPPATRSEFVRLSQSRAPFASQSARYGRSARCALGYGGDGARRGWICSGPW